MIGVGRTLNYILKISSLACVALSISQLADEAELRNTTRNHGSPGSLLRQQSNNTTEDIPQREERVNHQVQNRRPGTHRTPEQVKNRRPETHRTPEQVNNRRRGTHRTPEQVNNRRRGTHRTPEQVNVDLVVEDKNSQHKVSSTSQTGAILPNTNKTKKRGYYEIRRNNENSRHTVNHGENNHLEDKKAHVYKYQLMNKYFLPWTPELVFAAENHRGIQNSSTEGSQRFNPSSDLISSTDSSLSSQKQTSQPAEELVDKQSFPQRGLKSLNEIFSSFSRDAKEKLKEVKIAQTNDPGNVFDVAQTRKIQGLNISSNLSENSQIVREIKSSKIENEESPNYNNCLCKEDFWYCERNTYVPNNLPENITRLVIFRNYIVNLTVDAFHRYDQLKDLIIKTGEIRYLQEGCFNNLSRLFMLDLSYNQILYTADNIGEKVFQPLTSLKFLYLSGNNLITLKDSRYPDVAMSYLTKLVYLNLDAISSSSFGSGFQNMTSLQNLTISCSLNRLNKLLNSTFKHLSHIAMLNISYCRLNGRDIEIGTFLPLTSLKTLDISLNPSLQLIHLPLLLYGLRESNLETLIMNYMINDGVVNFVVNSSHIQNFPQNLKTLIAKGNNIITIDASVLTNLPKTLKVIDVTDNGMIVDPMTLPLEELESLEFFWGGDSGCPEYEYESFIFNITEPKTMKKRRTFSPTVDDNTKQALPRESPPNIDYVRINARDTALFYKTLLSARNSAIKVMDFGCGHIEAFPFILLSEMYELWYVNLRRTNLEYFGRMPPDSELNMIVLVLQHNNLGNFFMNSGLGTFSRLSNLLFLDISYNQLSAIDEYLFNTLWNMKYLIMNNNPLTEFKAHISNMEQLELLNLSNTYISRLPEFVMEEIDEMNKAAPRQLALDLAGCPISCDCPNLDFLKWMVRSSVFVKNFTGYMCKYPDTSTKFILDGYKETIWVLDRECAKNYPMFLTVLGATAVLMFTMFGLIFYRLRWKLRYLYYAAYLSMTKKKHNNGSAEQYTYDTFLSYDSEDQHFVQNKLSPELEARGLNLLIHGRDFVAGTYIASNIVMAVTESRRTLVVLTRHLLESSWCNYELQMATMESTHRGHPVLVFLLKENIPNKDLGVELLQHIRSNTYLPYPSLEEGEEPDQDSMTRFYDKLAHDLRC